MAFWYGVIGVIAASVLVFGALSINRKTDAPAGQDSHGHGHGHAHH